MYVHEANLEKKIIDAIDGSDAEGALIALREIYNEYRSSMESLRYEECDIAVFDVAADKLNNYLLEVDRVIGSYEIKSQAKLRSSVLEELSMYLLKNNSVVVENDLEFFNKKVYAGILVERNLTYKVLSKDVDFCIGKTTTMSINGQEEDVRFPFVCVEVKTYVDATMNREILFSGTQLKTASPDVKTYVLMEYLDEISPDSPVPASYSYAIDRRFSLRNCKRPKTEARARALTPISGSLLLDYYKHIIENI